jgi:hypothetical protein
VHHIFPKSQLYKVGYGRPKVNALANYCFLTQTSNLAISNILPEVYFEQIEEKYPGALASQWIPMDRQLWHIENYLDFLAAREQLLAEAATTFLDSLLVGATRAPLVEPPVTILTVAVKEQAVDEDEELLLDLNTWVVEQGLAEGEFYYELTDPDTSAVRARLELAWPFGLQLGYSEPVAFELEADPEALSAASQAGYRCFTTPEALRSYIQEAILAPGPEPA